MARWPKTDKRGGKMYWGKYSLLSDLTKWRSCSGVARGCVPRIRRWPLRRDDCSADLIGAAETRRCDWLARLKASDVSARIDR